ncbi:IspD/TarI family cytidylyltransferase [Specibacter cremeus]|uniref:IspD/TarI family cytidylyltransferase n=1 Tax=Specibacter cremeus TaxID=1629051 RepID=UPI000F77CF91|nr:2-C-methyl-D-erythritol 4-phosphate cytidylyltransferase [Specibacter cremeus]
MNEHATNTFAVVLVAAGSGERLGHGIPKARVLLGGEPMLVHAVRGVLAAGCAAQVCIAVPPGDDELRGIAEALTVETAGTGAPAISVVDGGTDRAASVRAALDVLDPAITAVLIHDAARPLTPVVVYDRITEALDGGARAVIPALAVVDTIKIVEPARLPGTDATEAPGAPHVPAVERVQGTPARSRLRAVQTPQGFDLTTLRRAHAAAQDAAAQHAAGAAATPPEVTDDAMLVEALGVPVYVVHGSPHSLKITTPTDLLLAEALLQDPLAPRWVEG